MANAHGDIKRLHPILGREAGIWGRHGIAQVLEVADHIRDSQGRVSFQRDGWDLKLFVPQAGRVEGLKVKRKEDDLSVWTIFKPPN